jgi:histone H3/H4
MSPDNKDGNDYQITKHNVESLAHDMVDRVSDDAVLRVMAEEEPRIKEVFRRAQILAQHAGRKTVREEDVRMVYSYMDSELP